MKRLLFFSILVAFACQNRKHALNERASLHRDIDVFWKDFKNAVINSDSVRLSQLVDFPLETRGVLDTDPIVKYEKGQFMRLFKAFLKQPTGINANLNETEFGLIKRTERLDSIQGTRLGGMEFNKVKGQWKLTLIYVFAMDTTRK